VWVDVTVVVWRGIDPDQLAVRLGRGFLPAFGVDGTGALWVAWYDEAILMRRLDPASGRPTGPLHRAPAVDGGRVGRRLNRLVVGGACRRGAG